MMSARRVLVVDDDPDVTEMLGMMVEALGCEVRTANDGPAALAIAARFQPDVIVLDLYMPGVDGFEVASALRALPRDDCPELVAITGRDDARDRAVDAGFDAFFVKPISMAELRSVIGAHTRTRGPRSSS